MSGLLRRPFGLKGIRRWPPPAHGRCAPARPLARDRDGGPIRAITKHDLVALNDRCRAGTRRVRGLLTHRLDNRSLACIAEADSQGDRDGGPIGAITKQNLSLDPSRPPGSPAPPARQRRRSTLPMRACCPGRTCSGHAPRATSRARAASGGTGHTSGCDSAISVRHRWFTVRHQARGV